jgi:DNA mismatch repair protein MutS2
MTNFPEKTMLIENNPAMLKTLKLLEFELILERLAGYAASGEAADMIREEKPSDDPDTVAKTKEAVQAIISRINDGDTRGDTRRHFPSIGFLFSKLEVDGTVLETDEACAIGLFTERGEDLRKWLLPEPFFAETLVSMPDCGEIAAVVFRITDRDGNIRDLPELRSI